MEKRFILKLTFLMLLITQATLAETSPPAQQDFTYSATLSEGKQSLRQFELPYQILAGLERQDYGDLRIFNSQNQPVPFSISQIEPQTYQNNDVYNLRFFRLADSINQRAGLQIEFSENSTRFSFNAVANNAEPNYLLIENPRQRDDLQAIKLNWQQPDTTFSIRAKLESSDDLQNWQNVNDNITLYDLKYVGAALLQNTVNLPFANHAKYLRLSFLPSSTFTLQIEKISGEYHHTTSVERENWESFALEPGEHPNEWLFNTGSLIPVTKIEFKIPATGLFYQGSLYSKNDEPVQNSTRINRQPPNFKHEVKRALHRYPEYRTPEQRDNWRYQGTITQYRLLTASGEIVSEPVIILPSKDAQWQLVLDQPATLLADQIPTVKVAWHPVMVTFLAQGNSPYQVFYGNQKIPPFNAVLPPTVNDNSIETVEAQNIQTVEKVVVTTEQEKSAMTLEKVDWQKALLWALLISGVLLMGVMAYQLYLRMNQKKD